MTYSMNSVLTKAQMQENAQYIWDFLSPLGWSKNAVAGMLGNMQSESRVNPGAYQGYDNTRTDMGYGLVQWTPATKYFTWADARGLTRGAIDSQLQRILWEVANKQQWYSTTPMSFKQFTTSTDTPYNLGMLFGAKYERYLGYNTSPQTARGTQATAWYTFLTDATDTGDTGGDGAIYTHHPSAKNESDLIQLLLSDTLNGWGKR